MRRVLMPSLTMLWVIGAAMPGLTAQQLQAPAGFPAVGAPPAITVTATGAAPRKALRYAVPNGHREHMTIDTTMAMTIDAGGMSLPEMKLPTMRVGADMVVTAVSPAGDMTVTTTFSDVNWLSTPDTDPSMLSMLQGASADIKGLSGTSVISNRALTSEVHFDTSKITNPQIAQTLGSVQNMVQNLSLPLPEEAVGVGATWEVRLGMMSGGMQAFNKYTIELTALDEKTCAMKVALEQTAPPQAVSNPNMPAGVTASIDKFTSTATGTVKLQFDTLAPTSEMNLNTATAMSMDMGGTTQQMNMAMKMSAKVTPGIVK